VTITIIGWLLKLFGFAEEAEVLIRAHEAKKHAQAVADAPETADELAERLEEGDV
jgi:hypothetical protein